MLQRTIRLYQNAYAGLSRDIWMLSFVSLINRAGTMVIPFMTIYLTVNMDFSLKEAGWIMSIFGMGSIVGSYLGGVLTDRIGSYKVQLWSLILTGLFFPAMILAESFWEITAMVFILSSIGDAFRPANKVAVSQYSKPKNLTRSFALLRLAVNVGFAIGPALGGFLAAWKGYDLLFWADGITCILAAIIFRMFLREKGSSPEAKKEAAATEVIRNPYQDRPFWLFLLILFCLAFTFMQFFFTMPVYFKETIGITEREIGFFMGLNGLIIVLLEMPLVYLVEKSFSKFQSMAMGAVLVGIGFLIFNSIPAWWGIAGVAILFLTLGEIYWMPFAASFTASRASESNRGKYMALYTMSWATATVAAPTLGFSIAENWGFYSLWILLFTISLLGGVALLLLGKTVRSSTSVSW